MGGRRRGTAVIVIALLLSSLPQLAAADPAVTGWPSGMAVAGDSISTGYGSDTTNGFNDPLHAWATGTDANVNSHYLRILAMNAAISGHNANCANPGARMADLVSQVACVNSQHPGYAPILLGGNDVCAASEDTMTPVADFAAQFRAGLSALSSASPDARMFVLSLADVYQLWSLFHDDPTATTIWTTYGICQSMLANPQSLDPVDADRRARVRQRVVDYNAQLAAVCAEFVHCRFDGGAVFNTVFAPADVATYFDYFHPSTQGQAHLAAVAWAATFDFNDAVPPTVGLSAGETAGGFLVSLSATDDVGVSGIEYRSGTGAYQRYTGPVLVTYGSSITYRADDVNGNASETSSFAASVGAPVQGSPVSRPGGVVTLSWSASSAAAWNAVTYAVKRATAGSGVYATVASGITALNFDDVAPNDGAYDYAITAQVGSASSADSNTQRGIVDRIAPATTATTAPAAGGNTVTLSATDANGVAAITYRIDAGAAQTYGTPFVAPFGSVVAYHATDAIGNVESDHQLASAVGAPVLRSATPIAAGGVRLSWDASTSATLNPVTYRIWRRPSGTPTFAVVAGGIDALGYTDTPNADGAYEYAVDAVVGTSVSALSNSVGARSDRTPPSAVQLSATTGSASGTVTLTWTAAADTGTGVAGYTVRYVGAQTCPAASPSNYPQSTTTGTATSATIAGLMSGKRYCFYVTSSDVAGNVSAPSNVASAKAR